MRCNRLVVLLCALATPAWAQDSGEAPDQGVARVSVISGDVTVRRGDSGEFVAAELNAPLVALDHLQTDQNSRAEIQLDWANFVRLAPESEVRLAELKDRDFLIQVSAGTVTFRVLRDSEAQVEISTPNVALRPRQQGTYRVTVRDDATEITVRDGEGEIFVGGNTDSIRAGQTLLVRGDPANPQLAYFDAIARDDWDRWNETRDRNLGRPDTYKYVSRDIYGAEDLAGYGQWVYDAPYGWVWVPRVAVSWAPYRVGRWTWVNYYGWTWVSGDPWGWAPYHYGRWYHAPRYGWVWYPGEVRVRYYWRPALVTFFGWGSNVGWVALAPHEVYRPWYGSNRTIVNNVSYVTNINVVGNFKNARFISGRSGVTSVVSRDFGRRKITINNFVVARDRDLKNAGDARRWMPNEPSRENRQFSDRQVSSRVSSRRESDRDFVTSRPDRGRRDTNRSPSNPPENVRRVDASARNDSPSPRTEPERGRQQEDNRGRGGPDNARRVEAPQRNQAAVAFPRNESERGRPQQQASRPENDSTRDAPRRNEAVVFPGREQPRARQAEANRGRSETSVAAAPRANRPENPGQAQAPQRNAAMTFPRTGERPRQSEGRGNGANSNVNPAPSRPSEPARVATPQREANPAPRSESNQGRAEAPARREPEVARANPEVFRREPTVRQNESPNPGRFPSGSRPEAVQRPQEPQGRPGRSPSAEREQPRESARPSPAPQSAPEATSAPAPSPSQGNNSGGRGRGRRD